MKIKLYFYCVLIIAVLYPASARARTAGRDLKKLINDSDLVASVTASQIVEQDNTVRCELSVEKFFKRDDLANKNLAITMPIPRPGQRPRPDSVVQGQRYLVFLKQADSALRLADDILGVIHLRGEKKMRNYVLNGSGAKLMRFNEPELLARVQELTADIAPVRQIQKAETPKPETQKTQLTQKTDGNAAPYYQKAISLYVEQPKSLGRFRCGETGCSMHLPPDTNEREKEALGKWFQANAKSLEQFHFGAQELYCTFTDTGDKVAAVISRLSNIKKPLQAMCLRAQLNVANGNFPKALDDIMDCYTIGCHFIAGPTLITEKLFGMMAQAKAMQITFSNINNQNLDTAFLAKIQNAFEERLTNYPSSFNLEGEKLFMQEEIQNDTQEEIQNNTSQKRYQIFLKGAFEYYDLIAQKTPWQLKDDAKIQKLKSKNMLVQMTGADKVAETYHKTKAMAQALTTTISVLRYKTDTGKVPQNLNELITAGYLKALPMDPYSDKSLAYKPRGNSFILYSVGADFDDDGGKHDDKWGADDGDYVFWPVQRPEKMN